MNTPPLYGGVTAIRGARIVVITGLLCTGLASPIGTEIPIRALVAVFTSPGVKCSDAPYSSVACVICAGVPIVTNHRIESDTDAGFTLVCVGADIAIITEQTVVNGMTALQCFLQLNACIFRAGIPVITEVLIRFPIAIVVQAVTEFGGWLISNTTGVSVCTGFYSRAGAKLIVHSACLRNAKIIHHPITIVVFVVTDFGLRWNRVTLTESLAVDTGSNSHTGTKVVVHTALGREA